MTRKIHPLFFVAAALLALAALPFLATAADHSEAPATQVDSAADIADLYAWHQDGKLITVMTYAGLASTSAGQTAVYDEDVVYVVHIDNDGDNRADIRVQTRFGQNDQGGWGVQVKNLPGAAGTVSGPVETTIDAGNGLSVFSGLRDDPFFFDLDGFEDTLSSGTLMFDSGRDSLTGLNVSAIVLEMDLDAATGGTDTANIWATTGRK